MARWRLREKHYIFIEAIDGEEVVYVQVEQDVKTGRNRRRVFPVPMFLDPADPSCWTESILGRNGAPIEGSIIVCDGSNPQPRDLILKEGTVPTPDMEPLDEEAEAISTKVNAGREHPIESLPGQMGMDMIARFEAQINNLLKATAQGQPAQPVVFKGIDPADFNKLQEQVAALMAKNAELEATQVDRRT